jgi:hypothetical protein
MCRSSPKCSARTLLRRSTSLKVRPEFSRARFRRTVPITVGYKFTQHPSVWAASEDAPPNRSPVTRKAAFTSPFQGQQIRRPNATPKLELFQAPASAQSKTVAAKGCREAAIFWPAVSPAVSPISRRIGLTKSEARGPGFSERNRNGKPLTGSPSPIVPAGWTIQGQTGPC